MIKSRTLIYRMTLDYLERLIMESKEDDNNLGGWFSENWPQKCDVLILHH